MQFRGRRWFHTRGSSGKKTDGVTKKSLGLRKKSGSSASSTTSSASSSTTNSASTGNPPSSVATAPPSSTAATPCDEFSPVQAIGWSSWSGSTNLEPTASAVASSPQSPKSSFLTVISRTSNKSSRLSTKTEEGEQAGEGLPPRRPRASPSATTTKLARLRKLGSPRNYPSTGPEGAGEGEGGGASTPPPLAPTAVVPTPSLFRKNEQIAPTEETEVKVPSEQKRADDDEAEVIASDEASRTEPGWKSGTTAEEARDVAGKKKSDKKSDDVVNKKGGGTAAADDAVREVEAACEREGAPAHEGEHGSSLVPSPMTVARIPSTDEREIPENRETPSLQRSISLSIPLLRRPLSFNTLVSTGTGAKTRYAVPGGDPSIGASFGGETLAREIGAVNDDGTVGTDGKGDWAHGYGQPNWDEARIMGSLAPPVSVASVSASQRDGAGANGHAKGSPAAPDYDDDSLATSPPVPKMQLSDISSISLPRALRDSSRNASNRYHGKMNDTASSSLFINILKWINFSSLAADDEEEEEEEAVTFAAEESMPPQELSFRPEFHFDSGVEPPGRAMAGRAERRKKELDEEKKRYKGRRKDAEYHRKEPDKFRKKEAKKRRWHKGKIQEGRLVEEQNDQNKDNLYSLERSGCNDGDKCEGKASIKSESKTSKTEDTKDSAAFLKEWGAWAKEGNSDERGSGHQTFLTMEAMEQLIACIQGVRS